MENNTKELNLEEMEKVIGGASQGTIDPALIDVFEKYIEQVMAKGGNN